MPLVKDDFVPDTDDFIPDTVQDDFTPDIEDDFIPTTDDFVPDKQPKKEKPKTTLLEKVGRALRIGEEAVTKPIVAGLKRVGVIEPEKEIRYQPELFRELYPGKTGAVETVTSTLEKPPEKPIVAGLKTFAREVAGGAASILLDPMTYLTLGAKPALKGIEASISLGKLPILPTKALQATRIPALVEKTGEALRGIKPIEELGKAFVPGFRPAGVSKEVWNTLMKAEREAKLIEKLGTEDAITFATGVKKEIGTLKKTGVTDTEIKQVLESVEKRGYAENLPADLKPIWNKLVKYADDIGARRGKIGKTLIDEEDYDYWFHNLSRVEREKMEKLGLDLGFREFTTKSPLDMARKVLKFVDNSTGQEAVGTAENLGLKKIGTREVLTRQEELIDDLLNVRKDKIGIETKVGQIALTKEQALNKSSELNKEILMRDKQAKELFGKAGTANVNIPASKLTDLEKLNYKLIEQESKGLKAERDMLELVAGKSGKELTQILNSRKYLDTVAKHNDVQRSVEELSNQINALPGKAFQKGGKVYLDRQGRILSSGQPTINEVEKAFGKEFFSTDIPETAYIMGRGLSKQEAGTQFFEQAGKLGSDTPVEGWLKSTAPELGGKYFNPQVIKEIDKVKKAFTSDEQLNYFLKWFDKVQNAWKGWTLGPFPAYHFRNVIGNYWNNFLGDVTNPLVYKQAGKIQDKVLFGDTLAGYEKHIYESAQKQGILGRGLMRAEVEGVAPTAGKVEKAVSKIPEVGMKAGGYLEDNARLAHFIDKIQKGYKPDEAALSVKKYLFDYTEITGFEKNVMRRLAPFYTWSRKNIPLQIENLVKQPGKFAMIEKYRSQLGEEKEGERKNLPDWLQEKLAFKVGQTEKGQAKYVLMESLLPAADIFKLSRAWEVPWEMLNPVLKQAVEQTLNRDVYFDRELKKYGGQKREFLNIKMDPRMEHLLRAFRILNEMDRLVGDKGREEREKRDWKEKALAALTGIKIYPQDMNKLRMWSNKKADDTLRFIKRDLQKAVRDKDKTEIERLQKLLQETAKEKL